MLLTDSKQTQGYNFLENFKVFTWKTRQSRRRWFLL